MIRLTKINHVDVVINSDLIEHIETTPDTVLTLTSGQKIMVLESPDEIVDRVVAFRKRIYGSIAELQQDLDEWIRSYNENRPHQGRWCFGKTPMQTFLDSSSYYT